MTMSTPLRLTASVSHRTWTTSAGEALAIVQDLHTQKTATLDGASAILWGHIGSGCDLAELQAVGMRLGCDGTEVGEFVSMLATQGFLEHEARCSEVPQDGAGIALAAAGDRLVEEDVRAWVSMHGLLYSAHWELTYRCNMRCLHCYNPGAAHSVGEAPRRSTVEMRLAEATSVLDDLRDIGVYRLVLSGGEASIHSDFLAILVAARERGFAVTLLTNGLALDEQQCVRIARAWPSLVALSIYSAFPAAHDAITGVPGSFERSVRALETLRQLGIATRIKSPQMHHTVVGWEGVRALADRLGAQLEFEMLISASRDGSTIPVALAAHDVDELTVLAATPGSPISVYPCDLRGRAAGGLVTIPLCGAAINSIGIDPAGNVVACNSLPIPGGSHRVHGIRNLWRATHSFRSANPDHVPPAALAAAVGPLSDWQRMRIEDFDRCGSRRECGWCLKCPGLAMLEHGDPRRSTLQACRLATARMRAAEALAAGATRDQLAVRLGVPLDFGRRAPRRLHVLAS